MDAGGRSLRATGRAGAQRATGEQDLIAQLQVVVRSRQLVGQATGVLIATYRISAEQAWEMLSGASQHANIKVLRLAEAVVQTACGVAVVDDAARDAVMRYLLPDGSRTPARAQPHAAEDDQLSSEDRVALGVARDELARERDHAADLADHQAATRDAAAVGRGAVASSARGAADSAADDRAAAADDRARARLDRRAAAVERALSAEDRAAAAACPGSDEVHPPDS